MRGIRSGTPLAAAAGLLALAAVLTACGGQERSPEADELPGEPHSLLLEVPIPEGGAPLGPIELAPEPPERLEAPELLDSVEGLEHEALGLSPMSAEISAVAEAIRARYGEDQGFGEIAVADDRGGLILFWYGEPPADLAGVTGDVPVEVVPSPYRRADLQRAVQEIFAAGTVHGPVTIAGSQPDGTGITIGVEAELTEQQRRALEADLSERVGVPVTVEAGVRVVPAGA